MTSSQPLQTPYDTGQLDATGIARHRRRRRPSGEPPPLPRALSTTGRYWLAAWLAAFAIVIVAANVPDLRLNIEIGDTAVTRWVANLRTGGLTSVMLWLAYLCSRWAWLSLNWAIVVVLLVFRRFRHLLVFLGAQLVVSAMVAATSAVFMRPRPLNVEILGPWEGYAAPSRQVAALAATLIGALYTLVPHGRWRQLGKWLATVVLVAVSVARIYLGVDHLTDVLLGVIIGVAVPLVAFRLFAPNDIFPVTYRRGRGAHLDVGGARGVAIRHALEDQLGLIVLDVKPFGLSGSAGSTPLRICVKGDPNTFLFGKLYAATHLRSDRWYKLGRTLFYGRLEDEKPFNTVRRLVQQEDYALRLMRDHGLPTPTPYGIVELTPEREYLLVSEFYDDAVEIGEVDIDQEVIDDGLGIIRRLWDAGLAHRDIKPANLLVHDGRLKLIDVFFAEVRPTPWRQAVDLANMLLCLALRCDPKLVYERALREFSVSEIAEAFAATRGLAMPSQLRRLMRAQGRDLHAEFLRLLPERPPPISIQRWTVRRVGLWVAMLVGGLITALLLFNILPQAGLR